MGAKIGLVLDLKRAADRHGAGARRRAHRISGDGCRRGSKGARGHSDVKRLGGCHVQSDRSRDAPGLRDSRPHSWRRRESAAKRQRDVTFIREPVGERVSSGPIPNEGTT